MDYLLANVNTAFSRINWTTSHQVDNKGEGE